MSNAKPTPGPWRLDDLTERAHRETHISPEYHYIDAGEGFVSERNTGFGICGYLSLADARLIAAAPDLLEACKAQHKALDLLFAMLIERSAPGFYPSKSGQPWDALIAGNVAIAKAEGATP